MPTDHSEHILEKEKPTDQLHKPADSSDNLAVELSRIEAEAEQTQLESGDSSETPHPQFITPHTEEPLKLAPHAEKRLMRLVKSKRFWGLSIILVIVALVAAWFIAPARWWLLHAFGQRTTLTIHAVAPGEGEQTDAALKNVEIMVNGRMFATDEQGIVAITDQPYGPFEVKATKQGYAETSFTGTLDFDPFFYRLGGQEADEAAKDVHLDLKPTGVQVSFKAIDYLSSQPLTEGHYTVGDLTIKPNDQGIVAFKAPAEDDNTVSVRSNFAGKYTDKTFDLQFNATETPTIIFVPAGKHYFMSKRDGALGLYSSSLDGNEVQQLIPGTGKEGATAAFTVSPSGKFGVLASTRDGTRNEKNALLHRIYSIDLETKQMTKVDEAPYFEFADWAGDKLVYHVTSADGEQAAKLRVLDAAAKKSTDIATAQSFGRKIVSFDQVAFVQYDANGTALKASFKRADLKNGGIRDLVQDITGYTVIQADFDRVAVATLDQKWQEYNFNTGQLRATAQPTEQPSQVFLGSPSPDGLKRLLIDRIDGKFTLLTKSTADGAEKQLYGVGGLGGPVRWVQNDVIVFRVVNDRETADYAISTKGGEPRKISDVTATASTQGATTDPNLFRYY